MLARKRKITWIVRSPTRHKGHGQWGLDSTLLGGAILELGEMDLGWTPVFDLMMMMMMMMKMMMIAIVDMSRRGRWGCRGSGEKKQGMNGSEFCCPGRSEIKQRSATPRRIQRRGQGGRHDGDLVKDMKRIFWWKKIPHLVINLFNIPWSTWWINIPMNYTVWISHDEWQSS